MLHRPATAVGLASFAALLAATAAGGQSLEVVVPAPTLAGSLTITPAADPATASVSGGSATIALGYTEVVDSRTINGSPALTGWNASVALSTPMTKIDDATKQIAGSAMTWTTGTRQKYNGAVLGWGSTAEFTGGTGALSSPVTAASAATSTGHGNFRYDATITINLSGVDGGTYRGAITQSVS